MKDEMDTPSGQDNTSVLSPQNQNEETRRHEFFYPRRDMLQLYHYYKPNLSKTTKVLNISCMDIVTPELNNSHPTPEKTKHHLEHPTVETDAKLEEKIHSNDPPKSSMESSKSRSKDSFRYRQSGNYNERLKEGNNNERTFNWRVSDPNATTSIRSFRRTSKEDSSNLPNKEHSTVVSTTPPSFFNARLKSNNHGPLEENHTNSQFTEDSLLENANTSASYQSNSGGATTSEISSLTNNSSAAKREASVTSKKHPSLNPNKSRNRLERLDFTQINNDSRGPSPINASENVYSPIQRVSPPPRDLEMLASNKRPERTSSGHNLPNTTPGETTRTNSRFTSDSSWRQLGKFRQGETSSIQTTNKVNNYGNPPLLEAQAPVIPMIRTPYQLRPIRDGKKTLKPEASEHSTQPEVNIDEDKDIPNKDGSPLALKTSQKESSFTPCTHSTDVPKSEIPKDNLTRNLSPQPSNTKKLEVGSVKASTQTMGTKETKVSHESKEELKDHSTIDQNESGKSFWEESPIIRRRHTVNRQTPPAASSTHEVDTQETNNITSANKVFSTPISSTVAPESQSNNSSCIPSNTTSSITSSLQQPDEVNEEPNIYQNSKTPVETNQKKFVDTILKQTLETFDQPIQDSHQKLTVETNLKPNIEPISRPLKDSLTKFVDSTNADVEISPLLANLSINSGNNIDKSSPILMETKSQINFGSASLSIPAQTDMDDKSNIKKPISNINEMKEQALQPSGNISLFSNSIVNEILKDSFVEKELNFQGVNTPKGPATQERSYLNLLLERKFDLDDVMGPEHFTHPPQQFASTDLDFHPISPQFTKPLPETDQNSIMFLQSANNNKAFTNSSLFSATWNNKLPNTTSPFPNPININPITSTPPTLSNNASPTSISSPIILPSTTNPSTLSSSNIVQTTNLIASPTGTPKNTITHQNTLPINHNISTLPQIPPLNLLNSPTLNHSNIHNMDRPIWYYRDPKGFVHGPFSSLQMYKWWQGNFFPLDLPMRFDLSMPWKEFSVLFPPLSGEPFKYLPTVYHDTTPQITMPDDHSLEILPPQFDATNFLNKNIPSLSSHEHIHIPQDRSQIEMAKTNKVITEFSDLANTMHSATSQVTHIHSATIPTISTHTPPIQTSPKPTTLKQPSGSFLSHSQPSIQSQSTSSHPIPLQSSSQPFTLNQTPKVQVTSPQATSPQATSPQASSPQATSPQATSPQATSAQKSTQPISSLFNTQQVTQQTKASVNVVNEIPLLDKLNKIDSKFEPKASQSRKLSKGAKKQSLTAPTKTVPENNKQQNNTFLVNSTAPEISTNKTREQMASDIKSMLQINVDPSKNTSKPITESTSTKIEAKSTSSIKTDVKVKVVPKNENKAKVSQPIQNEHIISESLAYDKHLQNSLKPSTTTTHTMPTVTVQTVTPPKSKSNGNNDVTFNAWQTPLNQKISTFADIMKTQIQEEALPTEPKVVSTPKIPTTYIKPAWNLSEINGQTTVELDDFPDLKNNTDKSKLKTKFNPKADPPLSGNTKNTPNKPTNNLTDNVHTSLSRPNNRKAWNIEPNQNDLTSFVKHNENEGTMDEICIEISNLLAEHEIFIENYKLKQFTKAQSSTDLLELLPFHSSASIKLSQQIFNFIQEKTNSQNGNNNESNKYPIEPSSPKGKKKRSTRQIPLSEFGAISFDSRRKKREQYELA